MVFIGGHHLKYFHFPEDYYGEKQLSPWINYFKTRTPIPKFYQVHLGKKDYGTPESGRVLPFETFVKECLQSKIIK